MDVIIISTGTTKLHAVNLLYSILICTVASWLETLILICSIFYLNWQVARLTQFDVTCKEGLTMQLICHSILICSIFHLNWRVARLIQFDVICKVGLTMQLQ